MNTKTVALTIVLAAITVVLNPGVSGIAIPSFVPTLSFQIWEITVYTTFFLLGIKIAFAISILNAVIRLTIFPGASFNQPIIHLASVLSTLIGVYVGYKIVTRKKIGVDVSKQKVVLSTTAVGILFRLIIMMPFIYLVALMLGNTLVLGLVPLIAIHDLIAAAYSIPLGYIIANVVTRNIQLNES